MHGKLFLIRHAETDSNAQNRNVGLNDISLNAKGRSTAVQLARILASVSFNRIVHSPLKRAEETARIIAEHAGLSPSINEAQGLVDLDIGDWQGLEHSALNARADFQAFVTDPHRNPITGGESLRAARTRAMEVIKDLETRCGPDDNLLLVTHSDIIRLVFTSFLGVEPGHYLRLRVETASVSVVNRATRQLELSNWTPELFK